MTPGPPTAPCTHTDAPSSGTRRVQRLQRLSARAECNAPERLGTERSSHRAQRTARTHPSPPRPASGTPPGIPPRRPSPDRRRVSRAANLPVPAECNGPGNLPGTHQVKAVRKTRRHATSDGPAQETGGGMQPDGRATHRRPCRFHEPALTAAGCPGRESRTGEKRSARREQDAPLRRLIACAAPRSTPLSVGNPNPAGSDNLPPLAQPRRRWPM